MRIATKSIYKGSETDKPKIISVCLFRMKKSYMGFSKYLNFCIKFVEQTQQILPDWFVRIYVDESVQEDELEKIKADHVEIVLYKCDEFWDNESRTHEGAVGTFMRFLPLFSAQKYEAMISSDIDIGDFFLEYFKYFDKNADEVGLVNQLCYNNWIPEDLKYSILAGGIYSRIVFPRQLLTNFLTKLKAGKIETKKIKSTDTNTYIPYGTDELFLTTTLYDYLEDNKIKVMTLTLASIVSGLQNILKEVKDERKIKTEKYMKKLMYLYTEFWKDPRKLKPDAFKKYAEPIVELIQPELENSRHAKCILDYLDHPKMVRLHKYNY